MDFVQKELDRQIKRFENKHGDAKYSTLASLYRILLEYQLFLTFACLWDYSEASLTRDEKSEVISVLKRPVLGNLLDKIMMLNRDEDNTILGIKGSKYKNQMERFISIRNKTFAHGMLVPNLQEKVYKEIYNDLKDIYQTLIEINIPVITENCIFYYREDINDSEIIMFDTDDFKYLTLDKLEMSYVGLDECDLSYKIGVDIYRISPFIMVKQMGAVGNYEFFCYSSYNTQNNRFDYCKVSEFDEKPRDTKFFPGYFQSYQTENRYTFCKVNGIICNKFENNYDYFINVDPIRKYVTQVWDFLNKNRSNTSLTIRGGGGIGKTALVQYICEKYLFEPINNSTPFEYVVFCSAKDRELKQTKNLVGTVQEIQTEKVVRSYHDILTIISHVFDLGIEADSEDNVHIIENELITHKGILLIIDDFETLPQSEKENVVNLIPRLSVDMHKVIITTRSQYMIGEEYYIPEMNKSQVLDFLYETIGNTAQRLNDENLLEKYKAFISVKSNKNKIFSLSQGTPLLTLQVAKLLRITDFNSNELLDTWGKDVEDFLLGRLYQYFNTKTSKILFIAIAQYCKFGETEISMYELTCIYKLYCSYFEEDDVDFIQDLQELRKMRIVYIESDYVKVCNNITSGVLESCKKALLDSQNTSRRIFDDRLIKMAVETDIEKAILDYLSVDNSVVGISYVQVFALDNYLKYTNEDRFQIIEQYVRSNMLQNDDTLFLLKSFELIHPYFLMENQFNQFFAKLCSSYNYVIPELENWMSGGTITTLISQLNDELDDIQGSIDDWLYNKKKKDTPRGFIEQLGREINGKIGLMCNYTINELCKYNPVAHAAEISEIINKMDEISTTREFSMTDFAAYQNLKKIIEVC